MTIGGINTFNSFQGPQKPGDPQPHLSSNGPQKPGDPQLHLSSNESSNNISEIINQLMELIASGGSGGPQKEGDPDPLKNMFSSLA